MTITKYRRCYWAVHDNEELVCITLYKKRAWEVARRLNESREPYPGKEESMFIQIKSDNIKRTLEEIISLLNWEDTVHPSEPIKRRWRTCHSRRESSAVAAGSNTSRRESKPHACTPGESGPHSEGNSESLDLP